jgi:hypothetical protein
MTPLLKSDAGQPAGIGRSTCAPGSSIAQQIGPIGYALRTLPMMTEAKLTRRFPARLLRSWGEKGLMVVAVVVAVIGLLRFEPPATRPTRELEVDEPGGSGIIVHDEVLHVWLPATFIALAAEECLYVAAATHRELQSFLEQRGQENFWYAVTIRGHQANGGMEDIAFIRFPYRDPDHVSEFQEALAAAAGNPTSRYFQAAVHILPANLPERAFRDVLEQWPPRSLSPASPGRNQVTD